MNAHDDDRSDASDRSAEIRHRAEKLADDSFLELWTLVAESESIMAQIAPAKRQPWLQNVVDEVYAQQKGKCALCGHEMSRAEVSVDHTIPFCYGGGNERQNLKLAHLRCNQQKQRQVDPHELLRYLEDRYMNRPRF